MKTLQEQIEVMQHYANGGDIEIFLNDNWVDAMIQIIIDGMKINVSNLTIKQFLELIELNKDKEFDFNIYPAGYKIR